MLIVLLAFTIPAGFRRGCLEGLICMHFNALSCARFFSQSHQQLPSSHTTDKEAVVAVDVAASANITRVEEQEVSGARAIRSRRPIVAVRLRMAQRTIAEVAAAQKEVGGVQALFFWQNTANRGSPNYITRRIILPQKYPK